MDKDKVKNDFWEIIKNYIPAPIIIALGFYAVAVFFGFNAYTKIVSNETLKDSMEKGKYQEYIDATTDFFRQAFFSATVILSLFIILVVIILIINKKRNKKTSFVEAKSNKNSKSMPEGRIDAFIVQQDEKSRDSKYDIIYKTVESTYWVLGVSLTSVVEREPTLKNLAKKKVKIRTCLMNPMIAVENICVNSVENDVCELAKCIVNAKGSSIDESSISEKLKECKNLLKIRNVLIDDVHFNEYYATDTVYRKKVEQSYVNLKNIRVGIEQACGKGSFELKTSNSFIPMSMTIADANSDKGKMIVEFHLPFTSYKVLFEINKTENKDLFEVFVNFYLRIWEKGNPCK